MHDTGFRKNLIADPQAVDVFVGSPILTVTAKPFHIGLDWTMPSGLQTALQNNGGIASFVIYRCESGSCDCTPVGPPSGIPYATVPGNQFSFADTQVNAGDTYTYMVSYVYFDACSQLNETSPPSSTLCAQTCGSGCSSPEVLITGNNWANGDQQDPGPIETYDFEDGTLVNSFTPQSAAGYSGRGLAIYSTPTVTNIYYTELEYYGADGDGEVHICSYGTEGSGAQTDSGSFPTPDPRTDPLTGNPLAIQDLAFHIDPKTGANELFVMSGWGNAQPQIFEIDPSGNTIASGSVPEGGISVASPAADDSDGFAVLTNATDGKLYFLINEGDASAYYDEYDTGGNCVSGSFPYINLQDYIPQCNSTGVSASRDGKSLYFIANPGITSPTLLQITLPSMHAVSQAIYNPVVGYRGIEDIDVLPLQ